MKFRSKGQGKEFSRNFDYDPNDVLDHTHTHVDIISEFRNNLYLVGDRY